jgi:phosphoribosylanthranilate isomerase
MRRGYSFGFGDAKIRRVLVQIYGMTTAQDAADVDCLDPDTIGVVLDEGIPTWDSVDDATARGIVLAVTRARVVALSLATDLERILATFRTLKPDILHLARADAVEEQSLLRIRTAIEPASLMLTVPVEGMSSVALAQRLSEYGDYVLLDTKHPDTGVVGATGQTHDWTTSAAIVEALDTPVILAGGLGPDNVSDAISVVRPFGVDSETRTSLDIDRRRKDIAKVEAFIAVARTR